MAPPKRLKEPSAFPRVNNHQKFSAMRLIPVINQKNYFTNYLKKDSQYLGRKIRERAEDDEKRLVVLQIGSQNLKIGLASEQQPKTLPFCVAKMQDYYASPTPYFDPAEFNSGRENVTQSFMDRMKFYKMRTVPNAREICSDFNRRQQGSPIIDHNSNGSTEDPTSLTKRFCQTTNLPVTHRLFHPMVRGVLNEDPCFYRSAQELLSDIAGIFEHALSSKQGLNITDLRSNAYDLVLVVPDLLSRRALTVIVDQLFEVGVANIAIIQEAVAATYGAGISAACVINVGAETVSVSCVDDGACIADSRVKLDFGGRDLTLAFKRLLQDISFPGNPSDLVMQQLKEQFLTVNGADISVQLYQYYLGNLKYDFKVYNEVMLPVLGLFYPSLFSIPPQLPWRFTLFPKCTDPYTSLPSEPISDADINIRHNTLAVHNQSYLDRALPLSNDANGEEVDDNDDEVDASVLDADNDDETELVSRDITPTSDASNAPNKEFRDRDLPVTKSAQMRAYESLNLLNTAICPLDHAIIESISHAERISGTPKPFYENLLVIGGGAKIPNFYSLLTDRLLMWNQARIKELGEVGVMAMPRDMEPEFISWRGGCVYAKLKVIDEMWTTRHEWDVLGSRALYYKAALYIL